VERPARNRGFSALALALLAATVLTGYLVHRDYGVSWDEPIQHGYGRNVVANALKGGGNASDDPLKAYGPAYEVALVAAQFVSGVRDTADIFALRHLLNFLTFTVGLVFFFRFGALFLRSRPASLAACAALVLSPVIFGHAFFNSKDLPFLTFFVVAMYSLVCFLDRPRLSTALAHAAASGWLIAIRVPGLLIVFLTASAAIWMAVRASADSAPLASLAMGRPVLRLHGDLHGTFLAVTLGASMDELRARGADDEPVSVAGRRDVCGSPTAGHVASVALRTDVDCDHDASGLPRWICRGTSYDRRRRMGGAATSTQFGRRCARGSCWRGSLLRSSA
jgi:hypothetical protein